MASNGAQDLESGTNVPVEETKAGNEVNEPYLPVSEIAVNHPESRIDLSDLEKTKGLTSDEAKKRLEQYGSNVLTPPKRIPEWLRFVNQFKDLFLLLLIACAILSLISFFAFNDYTNLYLGVVLLVVVFLTGLEGFHEEGKAVKTINSFATILPAKCTVIRDGHQQEIEAALLVPGDIILLNGGQKVPADLVILKCRGLKTDCSMITGEAELVSCSDAPSKIGTGLFECTNMGFNGSLCFDGTAIGLVVRTGDLTAIGTFAKLVSNTRNQESTLQVEVRNFVKLVGIIAVSMATVAFIVSILKQGANTAEEIFKIFVNGFLVIMVANIPQGLPSTVISLLSLAARKMALRQVLVKRLDCVETLGSTSIICSDKTGTLTMNQMTVTDIWYNRRMVRTNRKECDSLHTQQCQALMFRCAIICNRAEPSTPEDAKERMDAFQQTVTRLSNISQLSWASSTRKSLKNVTEDAAKLPKYTGNPSDVALLNYFDKSNAVFFLRHSYPIIFEVPFNSTNKWQLVIVKSFNQANANDDSGNSQCEYQILMKGAPEKILARCRTYASTNKDLSSDNNEEVPIDQAFTDEFDSIYHKFASQGRRVLAFCSTTFMAPHDFAFEADENGGYNFPTTNLKFIGMTAIMDPPRDNVPSSIASCHEAGVKVYMVTGDHPLTGKAIALEIGLLQSENNIELLEETAKSSPSLPGDVTGWEDRSGAVIHGSRVEALTDEQWEILLSRKGGICFARTTPAHKQYIVEKCQKLGGGAIVAVTGDGVNDAPALKQANIGIAMGLNGSAVAHDAADILLMDDNFASIVNGIQEGRIIFDNIKKTIAYTMAHIFPEVLSALIALLVGIPAGLTALQVLCIDLGTEMFVAISLASEKPESDIMKRKPRDLVKDRLVSPVLLFYSYVISGGIISAGCMLSYAYTYWQNGIHLSDFFHGNLNNADYFTLSASEPVTIERTGRTYSAEEQQKIFSQGVTAFFITLTVAQFCHIWSCKTRINSLFTHGVTSNKHTFMGVGIGIVMVVFFSYVPFIQSILGSGTVAWFPWVLALVTGVVIFAYNETAKLYIRQCNRKGTDSALVRCIAW